MHESGSLSSEWNGTASEKNADDPAAMLEEWFQTHQGELLGTAYYLIGNLQDAQDTIQEVFLRCWNHRNQLAEIRDVQAWTFRITFNLVKDIRKAAWNRRKKNLPHRLSCLTAKEITPDEIVAEDEQMQLLRERIAGLDEPDKEVFLLRQNGDFTYGQIAELLAIPEGTVKTRMRRAIETLKK